MRKREIGILGGERAARRLTQSEALTADIFVQSKSSGTGNGWRRKKGKAVGHCTGGQVT
jgi:hypothetical protein